MVSQCFNKYFCIGTSNKIIMIFLKIKLTIFFSIMLHIALHAQPRRFIYLQTENKSPFFVKIDGKYLSSSEYGYIIIPQLTDSTYNLSIGSTENKWIAQDISISTKVANAGYLIQSKNSKNFALVNLSTMQPLKSINQQISGTSVEIVKSNDEFARILAEVVDDPTIAQIEVGNKIPDVKKENQSDKTETVNTRIPEKDPLTVTTAAVEKTEIKNTTIPENNTFKVATVVNSISEISRLSYVSMSDGLKMKYLDVSGIDTIDVFLPVKKTVRTKSLESESSASVKEPVQTVSSNSDKRFLDMKLQNPNIAADSVAAQNSDFVISEKKSDNSQASYNQSEIEKKGKSNSDCKSIATQTDFLKLRSHMASAGNEAEMTKTAIKIFASTCFTTEQIKNLGALYLIEEERYKFYVAAYPYVSDLFNFATLQDQLTDAYYQNRFKVMVNH